MDLAQEKTSLHGLDGITQRNCCVETLHVCMTHCPMTHGRIGVGTASGQHLTVAGTPVMKATSLPLALTRTPSIQSSW